MAAARRRWQILQERTSSSSRMKEEIPSEEERLPQQSNKPVREHCGGNTLSRKCIKRMDDSSPAIE